MSIRSVLRSAKRAVTPPQNDQPVSVDPEAAARGSMPDGAIPNPPNPDLLGDFRLFAVVKSWLDGDIIEATVRNAFAQGVERVYVIDNGSDDETVAHAAAAGAEIDEVYHTKQFNPRLAQVLINGLVAGNPCIAVSATSGGSTSTATSFPRAPMASPSGSTWRRWIAASESSEPSS